jgi:hypothetical protein
MVGADHIVTFGFGDRLQIFFPGIGKQRWHVLVEPGDSEQRSEDAAHHQFVTRSP